MSIKVRITAWITLMVLLLAAMTLVFVLVINHNAITDDPAGRLINVVQGNAKDVEFDRGKFEWDDLSMYSGGVYSQFYNTDGALLHGALPEDFTPDLEFSPNIVRTVSSGDKNYYIYDSYVDMDVTGLWVRGIISADDRSGVMHTITVLTATLLPILLAVTVGCGWLIAWSAMRPMEKILTAVDGISAGEDLSARLNMQRGPREMRRLSAAFDRMFARLEKSFDAERQFTSDASHELRTPLAVIKAECEYALSDNASEEDMLEALSSIDEQTDKMTKLVTALLTLSRTEQGDKRYKLEDTDLSELVKKTCADFVPAKNITLTADIEDNIIIPAQAQLISLMLENLLSNAVKYGRDGGHIEVRLKKDSGIVLSVKDDGIGIKEEDLPKIWGRFYRADESRSRESGFGLGLSLVSQIAALHGGKVSASSVCGEGSEFTVTF